MDSEKILTACESVLQAFDGLTGENEFWNGLSGFNEITKGMEDEIFDKWIDVIWKHAALAFATGYALGQMFDLSDKEILDDLDTVKKAIKEKALLPYLPRERKGA